MKPLNVYDSVNWGRLLGTHPRWQHPDEYRRFAVVNRPVLMTPYGTDMPTSIDISHVELQRKVIVSKDGWEAEVAFVTHAPLKDLMCIRDFGLPDEDDYAHAMRTRGY